MREVQIAVAKEIHKCVRTNSTRDLLFIIFFSALKQTPPQRFHKNEEKLHIIYPDYFYHKYNVLMLHSM